jgi:hypothetical protein
MKVFLKFNPFAHVNQFIWDSWPIVRNFVYFWSLLVGQLTKTKKMAACTFYENALQGSRVNDWKMTRNHLMIRNFCKTKKLTSSLMPVLQKTSIHFCKRLVQPRCTLIKSTPTIFFVINGQLHRNCIRCMIGAIFSEIIDQMDWYVTNWYNILGTLPLPRL